MTTQAPDSDNESPSNHPQFITPPSTNPRRHVPQVTQSQTPNSPVVNNDSNDTLDDEDNYLHYHDLDFVHQIQQHPDLTTTGPIAPIVYVPELTNICRKTALVNSCTTEKKKRAAGKNQICSEVCKD